MNVPAIAKQTFEELRHQSEFLDIVRHVLKKLKKIHDPLKRASFVHQKIEEHNKEVFSHPMISSLSPCRQGCSACCHTQVSVTYEEAELLASRVEQGVLIDLDLLAVQSGAGNDSAAFYAIPFEHRRCVFLDEQGSCRVYEHRPSVCRTNAVIGTADQCDTRTSLRSTRLVRTPKADMVIYAAFLQSAASGSLPFMLQEVLKKQEKKTG